MSKQTEVKKKRIRYVAPRLATQYQKDYEESIAEFPADKKIEFIEHLLECLDIIETYTSNPTKENWKIYAAKENAFLKKHGKRLKVYRQKRMYLYYGSSAVLAEKKIYTTEEFNSLSGEEQILSPEEFESFIFLCRNLLHFDKESLMVEQIPEDEREENNAKDYLAGGKKLHTSIKRKSHDKFTCLSQEQTVLLMYYLQEERVLLKDEYLSDLDAGIAFETLTGYSQNTLRQNLSHYHLYKNRTNLKVIENLLNRLKVAVGNDLKEK